MDNAIYVDGRRTEPCALEDTYETSRERGGAVGMRGRGRSRSFVALTWVATAVVLTAAVVAGNTLLSGMGEETLSVLRAFAAGAVLASVADTLMPDAYKEGGPLVAFATAAGFLLSFVLSHA